MYLDAVVPHEGQCLLDRTSAQFRASLDEQVRRNGDGWLLPAPGAQFLGLTREEDVRWVMPKLVPHPYRTFQEPPRLAGGGGAAISRTYINCIGDKPRGQPQTVQAEGIDDYHELQTGHDAMVTAPQEVADLLLAKAGARCV